MKVKEIRNKTSEERSQLKGSLAKDLMDARFKKAMGQLKDNSLIRKIRRDIARIDTIIRENQ
jgi:large subunit ribosomal protein L29